MQHIVQLSTSYSGRKGATPKTACGEWKGLYHNEQGSLGYWTDMRNLSPDASPALSIRRKRRQITELDGDTFGHILAALAWQHLVILDEYGAMHCNGHKLSGLLGSLNWILDPSTTMPGAEVGWVKAGAGNFAAAFGAVRQTVQLTYNGTNWGRMESGTWQSYSLASIALTWTGDTPYTGATITVRQTPQVAAHAGVERQMVMIGAKVVIIPDMVWANVVDLAAGTAMVSGTNYGSLNQTNKTSTGDTVTLTVCDLDGDPFASVVVGKTEPTDHTKMWIDTTEEATALRGYSESYAMYVVMDSPYVRIQAPGIAAGLNQGDAVAVSMAVQRGTMTKRLWREIKALLNSSHYIYEIHHADPDDPTDVDWVVVAGLISSDEESITTTANHNLTLARTAPEMDYVVECGNRLWGCRYGLNADGQTINEIYACALGDPSNWDVYQGISTDSYTASRGKAGPFTGAAVLGGCPLFFREDGLEKVYPSNTGAHQIQAYSLEGVEQGADRSLVVINERLYYKSPMGICVYTGTMPQRISEAFGRMRLTGGVAARDYRRYALRTTDADSGQAMLCVYDPETGQWYLEDDPGAVYMLTWQDELYAVLQDDSLMAMRGGADSRGVRWWAETGMLQLAFTESTWIKEIRVRASLDLGSTLRVLLSIDGGPWQRKGTIHGQTTHTQELHIRPRRCDNFRIRLEGTGGCRVYTVSYLSERSMLGH